MNNVLTELAKKENLKSIAFLTRDLHVWPDFHGNRSPIADPTLKGTVNAIPFTELFCLINFFNKNFRSAA